MKWPIAILLLFSSMPAAQNPGVLPEWEVRDAALALEKHTRVIDGLLAQLKPQEWIAKGAPEAYVEQLKQARQYNSYLVIQAQALAERPEKLSVALDTFFRLDYNRSLLESLNAGVRRYQNDALADLLSSAISQNSTTRERLKEYAQQLAVEREQEWEIANREAQRCRESLVKRPPAPPPARKAPAPKP